MYLFKELISKNSRQDSLNLGLKRGSSPTPIKDRDVVNAMIVKPGGRNNHQAPVT